MSLETGQIVDDKYRIVRLIGEGGMGAVYEGENVRIRRRVAIKVLNIAAAMSEELVARFEREAQAAGQIGNDHILEVLDLGRLPNGDRYMVMEYLDGETLLERIHRHGKLLPQQILPIATQFLSALAAAHAAGIIHRDLKPENIFVLKEKAGRRDFVKLIDFGVSKFVNLGPEASRVTRAGALIGTPCYLAPEQARGLGEVDVRSDVYACGVILYEAVTGRVPYEGDNFNDLLFKIALSDPPSPRSLAPAIDAEFEEIILTAMARDPASRFQSVEALTTALESWASARSVSLSLVPVKSRRTSVPDLPRLSSPSVPDFGSADAAGGAEEIDIGADIEAAGLKATMMDSLTSSPWARSQATDPPRPSRRLLAIGGAVGAALVIGLVAILLTRSGGDSSAAANGPVTPGPSATETHVAAPATGEATPSVPPTSAPTASIPEAATAAHPAASGTASKPVARPTASSPAASTPATASAKKPTGKPDKKATDFGY